MTSVPAGTSAFVEFDKDFKITSILVYMPKGYAQSSSFTLPCAVYGPLEVQGTNGLLETIANKLALLQYSLADRDSIEAKQKNQGVIDSATEDFFNGSDSNTSLGTGGLGGVKSVGNEIGNRFSSGASAKDIGSALDGAFSADGGLGWFSEQTASDIDTAPATFSRDGSQDIVTDYVGAYSSAVEAWFSQRSDSP